MPNVRNRVWTTLVCPVCMLQVRLTAFQSLGAFISTFADPSLTGLHLSDHGSVVYNPSSGIDRLSSGNVM